MATTLGAVVLPDDLYWGDEFSWNKVQQTLEYSATGALLVQEGLKQSGRFITLMGSENMAWITRETALQLIALKDVLNQIMTLTLSDARPFQVMFRQAENPLDIASVLGYNSLSAGAWFKVNAIRLIEVTT